MKILIIRFSSIGDIVLTTPVVRCCKQQIDKAEVHFITKSVFKPVLQHNPYLNKLITFEKDITEVYDVLKKENYDVVIDLHNNLRSRRLKMTLGKKSFSFKKLNVQKFLAVTFKSKNSLPDVHIVQRYLEAVESLGVRDDDKGLDYFLSADEKVNVASLSPALSSGFAALVVGGSYFTKKIPLNKLVEICNVSKLPIVLMGGKEDNEIAEQVIAKTTRLPDGQENIFNACGKFSINQSASIIEQSSYVVTSDTGLMHIASAFKKIIFSVWGNTIPEFGMYPYLPDPKSKILEVNNLKCRPCSKLGYSKCPKGHFKCMNDIDVNEIKL